MSVTLRVKNGHKGNSGLTARHCAVNGSHRGRRRRQGGAYGGHWWSTRQPQRKALPSHPPPSHATRAQREHGVLYVRLSVVLLPDSDWPNNRTLTSARVRLRSARSCLIMSSMCSLTLRASCSALRRFSRSIGDSFGGGRRAAARGSEVVLRRPWWSSLVGLGMTCSEEEREDSRQAIMKYKYTSDTYIITTFHFNPIF